MLWAMEETPWTAALIPDRRGRYPVVEFIRSQGDATIRARIVAKMRHLEKIEYEDFGRPLVDTLRGPLKELRVDEQLRVVFACHVERGLLFMLDADRKKNGHVDEAVIARAEKNLARWIEGGGENAITISRAEELLGITQRGR